MIEFFGEISEECRSRFAARDSRQLGIAFAAITGACAALTVVLGIIKHEEFYSFLGMTLLLGILTIILLVFAKPSSRRVKQIAGYGICNKIIIENGSITHSAYQFGKEIKSVRSVKKVKKVLDMGAEYYITFRILSTWICQKDLLVKGNIEDFENIFAGKLVRKQLKKREQ